MLQFVRYIEMLRSDALTRCCTKSLVCLIPLNKANANLATPVTKVEAPAETASATTTSSIFSLKGSVKICKDKLEFTVPHTEGEYL